jgi:hypothetical protein
MKENFLMDLEPENVPFIYRLKLYALFMNGENEAALYRQ